MTDDQLRIGDAERAAAAADLGEHFAQGRLTADEHEERLGTVLSARTRADMAPVFRDLPSPYAATTSPTTRPATGTTTRRTDRDPADRYRRSGLRPFRRGVPTPIVVILAAMLAITVVTHLPVILIGLLVFWFVAHRHAGHHGYGHGPRRGWRY